jgi:diacylglycerol kinase family enzyme
MLGVIINPNASGVRRANGVRARVRELGSRLGEVVETHTPAELAAAADRFAARGVDLVATVGGDGTNLSALTQLVRAYGADRLPRLAFLRGGTVNTVAANLHIHGRADQILERIIARLNAGQPLATEAHDLLEVTVDGRPPIFGFMFAAAMGARFLSAYYGGPIQGMPWALWLTARTMASSLFSGPLARWLFAPVATQLTVDGEPVRDLDEPRLLLCSTVADLGLGFKVTWQAGKRPGHFHVIASELSTTRMALQLPRVFTGRPLRGAPHLDRLARRASVTFASPQTITVDGELFRTRSVAVTIGARLEVARC